jgi:thiamine biosynthesis lipoprotein
MTVRVRLALYLSLIFVAACSDNSQLPSYDLNGSTMGTTFNITVVAPPTGIDLDKLQTKIQNHLEFIENIASTYRSDSELSEFNANPSTDWIRATPEFCQMVSASLDMSATTEGAFDVTVGPLVNLWGFGPTQQQDQDEVPTGDEVAAALSNVGYQKLETDCDHAVLRKTSADVYVDLSGWAKGHAVDRIAALLDEQRLTNYLVEIGGELRVRGHNAEQQEFKIAIEKPLANSEMSFTIMRLSDVSVATSGDYRNFFEEDGQRYSHTIDPRTGYPVDHQLTGVTVISRNTAFADAMATALMVLGPQDGHALAEKLRVAAYFIVRTDDGIEERSTTHFEELRRM